MFAAVAVVPHLLDVAERRAEMKRVEQDLPALNGRLLEVRGTHVWTHIEPARSGTARLRCAQLELEEDDATVTLTLPNTGFWFGRNDLQLWLPKGSRVRFRVEAGGLHAERIDDVDLDFQTQAGTMHAERISGRVRLHTKSGTIHVERLRGAFDVATMAGTIHLEIDDLIAGDHRARTYAGSLHCELAGHIEAHVEARATLGHVRNSARSYKDAVTRIELISDVGGVRVEQSKVSAPPADRCPPVTVEDILERVAKGLLGVEQADALLDRLERKKK